MTTWEHPAVWLDVQYQCFYNFTNQKVLVCVIRLTKQAAAM